MRLSVFDRLDRAVSDTLSQISLEDLVTEAEKHEGEEGLMFYI
jgi:DNA-binding IscR family transcriptional regulator